MKPFPGAGLPLLLALASAAVIALAQHPGLIREYQTLIAGAFVLVAAVMAWASVQRQLRQTERLRQEEMGAKLWAARVRLSRELVVVTEFVRDWKRYCADPSGPCPDGLESLPESTLRTLGTMAMLEPRLAPYLAALMNLIQVATSRSRKIRDLGALERLTPPASRDTALRNVDMAGDNPFLLLIRWSVIYQMLEPLFDYARFEPAHLSLHRSGMAEQIAASSMLPPHNPGWEAFREEWSRTAIIEQVRLDIESCQCELDRARKSVA